ncbi:MAG: Uma2 family endonuclease, partial [Myxococcota bacterium]
PSVRNYTLVAQDRSLVESYARQGDGTWSLSEYRAGDVIRDGTSGIQLPIDELYRRVLDRST